MNEHPPKKSKAETSNHHIHIHHPSGDSITSFKLELDKEAIHTTVNLFSGEYLKTNECRDDDQEIITQESIEHNPPIEQVVKVSQMRTQQ